jgi:hypothetical protein
MTARDFLFRQSSLTVVIGGLTLPEGRLQTKDHLTGHRAQRTPSGLRELPMQRFVAADSKLATACRFLAGHQSPPHGANTLRRVYDADLRDYSEGISRISTF